MVRWGGVAVPAVIKSMTTSTRGLFAALIRLTQAGTGMVQPMAILK